MERDIRSAVEYIWKTEDSSDLLAEICGGEPVAKRPSNKKFFEMMGRMGHMHYKEA